MRIRLAALPAAFGVILFGIASLHVPALGASTPKFLTLPFASGQKIVIQRAWTTFNPATGRFDLNHHAIDYVLGIRDHPDTWKKFDALAAAPGEACGALTNQGGCYKKAGENMGNRVLIKHKMDGVVYYTFYNHLDSIAKGIPLNDKNNTVHVDAGQKIGVVGASNSVGGLLHLHWELLDANLKPLDPYGIYGITDQYPDPRGKNGKLAKKSYFINNPPTAFGATPKPSPTPAATPAQTPSPGSSQVPSTPGSTAAAATPVAPASAGQTTGGTPPVPTASPGVTPPGTPDSGGSGAVLAAVGIGALVAAAVVLGLILLSRRRKRPMPQDGSWRP